MIHRMVAAHRRDSIPMLCITAETRHAHVFVVYLRCRHGLQCKLSASSPSETRVFPV